MDEDVQAISGDDSFFAPGFKDANSFSQEALRAIIMATKSSNDLPSAGDEFDFYCTFAGFREIMKRKRQSILSIMTSLIQSHGTREKFEGREADEKFDLLVDTNDAILENVSNYLDEALGLKEPENELVVAVKPSSAINTSWNKKQFSPVVSQKYKLVTAKNVSRPQLLFKDKIDNSNTAFIPILKDKPNSIKPLAITLENDGGKEEYCHPYELEIEKFTPSDDLLRPVEPLQPKPVEETPLIIVKSEEQLKELCDDLKKQKEIAVDLEHHSYRSFQGFTCLMQISTRDKDYIIDTLDLRSELHVLNDIFTDSKIVKVLHGADLDVIWLQRDLGVYLVNLFDTGQAARVLHFAHLSLSYLLKHYCKFDVDKKYQLADWRIRPLPDEMIKYAREDTHYLLYVYDCLKNDLIQKGNKLNNLLFSTFERSKLICAKRYQKLIFTDDKYLDLYKKCQKSLNAKQLLCFKELYSWRDRIARENDESYAYVLPNHMLLQIAEALPREQQGILACCNPIPPLVKQQLNELHSIVLKANDSSLKHLEFLELQEKAQTPKVVHNHIDLSSLIHCPHDIHHVEDRKMQATGPGESGANLLPILTKSHSSSSLLKKKAALSAFFRENIQPSERKMPEKVSEEIKKLISPFERYKIAQEMQPSSESSNKKSNKKATEDSASNAPEEETSDPATSKDVEELLTLENKESTSTQIVDPPSFMNAFAPLRKRKQKNKSKPIPNVSLIVPENDEPVRKKSKTPEIDGSFKPYDYSKSNLNFSGKKKSDETAQGKSADQTPKHYFGKRRRHGKLTTYKKETAHKHNMKWPKNN